MSWEPFQEPTGPQQPGPYIEYSAYTPAFGPQMPPPSYGAQSAWAGAGPGWQAAPLTLWEAIKRLPSQYWRVLTRPGAATFAAEMWQARWDVTWVQVLVLSLVSAVLTMLVWLIEAAIFTTLLAPLSAQSGDTSSSISLGIFLVPAPLIGLYAFATGVGGFFLGQGIVYLLAKAFGGQGTFLAQIYTTLLYQVPITIVTILLGLIPFVGSVGSLAGIYAYVLETFQMMAVHRLSTGKAIAVVLIPVGVGLLLGIILFLIFFSVLFSTLNTLSAPS